MTDDLPMASDMILDIEEWLKYVKQELKNERIDLVELSEIEQVYNIIKEQE